MLKSSKHSGKGISYQFLHEWLGTGLLTAAGLKWKSRSVHRFPSVSPAAAAAAHITACVAGIVLQAPDDYAVVPL